MIDLLKTIVSDQLVKQISSKQNIGDNKKTNQALKMAVPLILSALNKNTQSSSGKKSLETALQKKHTGSIFESMTDLVSNPDQGEGNGILKHLLGSQQSNLIQGLAKQVGIDPSQAGNIMKIAAPLVMGALGKEKNNGSNLQNILAQATGNMNSKNSGLSPLLSLLDQNGDGNVKDDLLKIGMKYLKNMFKK
jgi:hypothetical protein